MQIYLASLAALVGMAIYVALHYAWIGLRRPEAVTHRIFAALATVLVVYGTAIMAVHTDPRLALVRGVETLGWLCEMSAAGLLLAFVARFTGQDHRPLRYTLTAGLAVCAVMSLVLPEGLRSGPIRGIVTSTLPWGEPIHWCDAPYGAAYFTMLGLVASCFAWALTATWRAWRAGRAGRQLALLVSLTLMVLAVVNNVLADLNGWPTIPLIAHSFIFLAAIMGHVLSSELARTGELELRLRRAEQFAVVGRLAGGVAHDFGNILTCVQGYAELLHEQVKDRPIAREQAQAIAAAAGRGTALTKQLLAFARARPQTAATVGVDAGVILVEIAGLIRSGAAGIEVRMDLETGPTAVACDPTQLHSALLNMAVNARDAMPHGGVLRLGSSRRMPSPGLPLRHIPSPGPLLEIWVGDSGQGIPADVLPRIFELQYSTKGEHGTGIGLSQVDDMVKASGGTLCVETSHGRGTTMRMWLPLCAEVGSGLYAPSGAKVLVVAGNSSLDQLLSSCLGQLGFAVVRMGECDVAGLYAAVVDVDHAGEAGLDHVRALRNRLPVVVLADDPQQWPSGSVTIVVAKPADVMALGRALRQAHAAGQKNASSARHPSVSEAPV